MIPGGWTGGRGPGGDDPAMQKHISFFSGCFFYGTFLAPGGYWSLGIFVGWGCKFSVDHWTLVVTRHPTALTRPGCLVLASRRPNPLSSFLPPPLQVPITVPPACLPAE